MSEFVRYSVDDWSLLYRDGELVVGGSSYLADEYLAQLLSVEEREATGRVYELMSDRRTHRQVRTLAQVAALEEEHSHRTARARELLEESNELRRRAQQLLEGEGT